MLQIKKHNHALLSETFELVFQHFYLLSQHFVSAFLLIYFMAGMGFHSIHSQNIILIQYNLFDIKTEGAILVLHAHVSRDVLTFSHGVI